MTCGEFVKLCERHRLAQFTLEKNRRLLSKSELQGATKYVEKLRDELDYWLEQQKEIRA